MRGQKESCNCVECNSSQDGSRTLDLDVLNVTRSRKRSADDSDHQITSRNKGNEGFRSEYQYYTSLFDKQPEQPSIPQQKLQQPTTMQLQSNVLSITPTAVKVTYPSAAPSTTSLSTTVPKVQTILPSTSITSPTPPQSVAVPQGYIAPHLPPTISPFQWSQSPQIQPANQIASLQPQIQYHPQLQQMQPANYQLVQQQLLHQQQQQYQRFLQHQQLQMLDQIQSEQRDLLKRELQAKIHHNQLKEYLQSIILLKQPQLPQPQQNASSQLLSNSEMHAALKFAFPDFDLDKILAPTPAEYYQQQQQQLKLNPQHQLPQQPQICQSQFPSNQLPLQTQPRPPFPVPPQIQNPNNIPAYLHPLQLSPSQNL